MNGLREKKIIVLAFWILAPVAMYFVSSGLAYATALALSAVGVWPEGSLSAVLNFLQTLVFMATFFFGLLRISEVTFGKKISKRELGISPAIDFYDYFWGVVGFVAAMFLSGVVIAFVQYLFPNFNSNQPQSLGGVGAGSAVDYALIFATLVILPAFFEEMIFRGLIFGQLRKLSFEVGAGRFRVRIGGWIFSTIIVSLLFGFAHGQANVGIVTFVMSVVMCFLREKLNDSIWAGVVLHFIKNAVAFVAIYIVPMMRMF